MMPSYLLLPLLTLASQSDEDIAFQSIEDIGFNGSTNVRAGVYPEPRRAQLTEVRYWFGVSLSSHHSSCFWCPDALDGLEFWRSYVNTHMFSDTLGRRIFVDLHQQYDYKDPVLVRRNYEDFARDSSIFALFGPSWVGFNDIVAQVAATYDKVLVTWAFDDSNYYATPGPLLSTQDLPAGMPSLFPNTSAEIVARRLQGDCPGGSCSFDRIGDIASPHKLATSRVGNSGAHRLDDFEEVAPSAYGRQLQNLNDASTPCMTDEYMPYPFYASCNAITEPMESNLDLDAMQLGTWETLMIIPKGVRTTWTFATSIPRVESAFATYVSLKFEDEATGGCLFALETASMKAMQQATIENCPQVKICPSPSEHGGNTPPGDSGRTLDPEDYCITLPDSVRAAAWHEGNQREGPSGPGSMASQGWQTTFVTFDSPAAVDMRVSIHTERDDTLLNISVRHDGQQNCDPLSLSVTSGCLHCSHYACAQINGTDRYSKCSGTTAVSCDREPYPDGVMWQNRFTNVVDINVPETLQARHAVKSITEIKRTSLVFVYTTVVDIPPRAAGFGSVSFRRQCELLADYATSLTGEQYERTGISFPPEVSMGEYLRTLIRFGNLGGMAMVYCGSPSNAMQLVMSMKTYQMSPAVIVIDRPLGASFVQHLFAFNTIGFVEAFPMIYNESKLCDTFVSFADFLDRYRYFANKQFVSYAAMQTAAAGTILLHALRALPPDQLTTPGIIGYFKSSTMRTFWGDLTFRANGQRFVEALTSRRIVPLESAEDANLLNRYFSASILVIDDRSKAECDQCAGVSNSNSICHRPFVQAGQCGYTTFQLALDNWITKQLSVYPCRPGCYYHSLRCHACPPGKYRSISDLECRSCSTGRYQVYPGSHECRDCLEGADCPATDDWPIPRANFYLYILPGNRTPEDDRWWDALPGPDCRSPYRVEAIPKTYACDPTTVCQGLPLIEQRDKVLSNEFGRKVWYRAATTGWFDRVMAEDDIVCTDGNQGTFCGQCKVGYTMAPLYGTRHCRKCPESPVPMIVIIFVIAIVLALLGRILSRAASVAAFEAGSLACPLLRLIIHHAVVFGLIMETTRLDADRVAAILMLPVDVIYRPFEVSMADCLKKNTDTYFALKTSKQVMMLIIPLCSAAVISIHFGIDMIRTLWHCIIAVARSLRERTMTKKGSVVAEEGGQENEEQMFDVVEPQQPEEHEAVAEHEEPVSLPRSQKEEAQAKWAEAQERDKNWSTLYGPGRRFANSQETFTRINVVRTLFGEWIVMIFLFCPMVLRVMFRITACRKISIQDPLVQGDISLDVLIANFDVTCGSDEHNELTRGSYAARAIVMIGAPAIIILLNLVYRFRAWYDSVPHREICIFLFCGYRNDSTHHEIFLWLRTCLMIWVGSFDTRNVRVIFTVLILLLSFVVPLKTEPWDTSARRTLPDYDTHSLLALLLVVAAAVLCPFELDAVDSSPSIFSANVQRIIIVSVVMLNYSLMLYGLVRLFFFTVLTELDAIMLHSETDIDRSCILAHKFANKVFGLNPVAHIKFASHQAICVSRLSEAERTSFADSMVHAVSACIDSSSKFHTWLLENAINEAYRRAIKARQARWRQLYNTFGSRKFALLDLKIIRFFTISLRPPDIDTDVTAINEVDTTLSGPGSWKMEMGKKPEVWRNAVTVHEFHDALRSVAHDVMEHHPDLHKDPTAEAFGSLKSAETAKKEDVKTETQVWAEASSMQAFEADLVEQGNISYKTRKFALENEPSQQMWQMLAGDTEDYREHNAFAMEEREMEKKLKVLDAKIAKLREQLKEAGDTNVPNLEEDAPMPILEDEEEVREEAPQYIEEVSSRTFNVLIIGGKNLHNADGMLSGVSDPYVVCQLRKEWGVDPNSEWRTNHVMNELNPVWMQSKDMTNVSRGDVLVFDIYDNDQPTVSGFAPREDDSLGKVELFGDHFFDNGFSGPLDIQGENDEKWGQLQVKISIVDEAKKILEIHQHALDYMARNQSAHEFFGRTAYDDEYTMRTSATLLTRTRNVAGRVSNTVSQSTDASKNAEKTIL